MNPKRLKPLADAPKDGLVIHEIYQSIQGESTWAGVPCVFVRTTACNLRCTWCDTPHAFTEGGPMSLAAVLDKVTAFRTPLVEITGGEPLLQPNVLPLMKTLCDQGHTVLLETSGSLPVSDVDPRVHKIVDMKAPASGEEPQNRYDILPTLGAHDELKLVLADRADYEWAKALLARQSLACPVLVGPVWGQLDPQDLAAWILADRLGVRMQVQLHKYVWGPKTRGV